MGKAEGCIHERLIQIQLPSLVQMRGQQLQRLFQFAASHPLLKPAVASLESRMLLG